jgi:hypothetical protein
MVVNKDSDPDRSADV